jgi:serine/threonine protein kinase
MLTPPYHAKRNDIFFTRVWQMSMPDGSMAALKLVDPISEEARPLLFREHKFLSRLKDGPFVQHLAHGNLNDSYFLLTRWIDGFELTDESAMAIYLTDDTLRTVFREACQNIVDRLAIAGIKHRDIREKNILVENGQPVLIDFGWSIFQSEENVFTPKNLEEPDDQTALNKMLYRLLGTEVAS